MDRGWVASSFFTLDVSGRRIDVRSKVHKEHTFEILAGDRSGHEVACRPQAISFWYGGPKKMSGDSSAPYRLRHPECPQY